MDTEKTIPEKLLKPYDPKESEVLIYKKWEASGFFNPDICIEKGITEKDARAFSITMPPPNVTGILHMGHALMLTIQDVLIRYHRMKGYKTLWLPGTDHAAIATQSKVEKEIVKKEGKSRHDLGREELLKRVEQFAKESHDTIVNQIKVMGASCDWSREAFTLDEKRNLAVRTMFKKMYDDGLIYRGHKIINWDPKGQTTIADDEIVHEERKAKMYTFKYSRDFPISISTTRPETKVGDTAVAVNPKDERYKEFVGKEYDINFCGTDIHIKIIADDEVEQDFGTGALGVTPAHSITDWEIAERHGLPKIQVINEYAKMSLPNELLNGKKTTEAREIIVEWLKQENLLEKEEEIDQNVSTAERTGGIIEPLPKLQWFINVNKEIPERNNKTLKELMREPIISKQTRIIPDYFEKTYFNWIENLRDWCISRQIWYGHRIPVYYCKTGCEMRAEIENIDKCPECGGEITQDEDTLDTWFSSGMWTFSTLGWPEQTKDLETYHPTTVLETGYEIIFFWVARMILMSQYALGVSPFDVVYFNGTVRDGKGQKMSKSLGNGIDPIEIAEKYGADAGRVALLSGTAPGTDSKISEDKIKGYKHFANKIWNITRFILENTDKLDTDSLLNKTDQDIYDKWIEIQKEITSDLEEYRLHLAIEKIYQYAWYEFADIIIEESKNIFKNGNAEEKKSKSKLLSLVLKELLITLHPFMPFITEEIWSLLPNKKDSFVMVESWPKYYDK